MIITWNDWVESSQIEPSLELGDRDLIECANQIARWKNSTVDLERLKFPLRWLELKRRVKLVASAGADLTEAEKFLESAAKAIASGDQLSAIESIVHAVSKFVKADKQIHSSSIHIFWEYGFNSCNLAAVDADAKRIDAAGWAGLDSVALAVADDIRKLVKSGHFVGRLTIEYLDAGEDFVRITVDAADPLMREIASFKKQNTGKWRRASMDLVNARFAGGLNGADIRIQNPVRLVRIDGIVYSTKR